MTRYPVKSALAVGASLLLAGTIVFSSFAEAQFQGGGGGRPGGGAKGPPGGGGGGPKGPPGGGGGSKGPIFKPGPGGGGGFKPPIGKRPPPDFKHRPPIVRPRPPLPPRHRPRPPGVRFWYWSGVPIFATDYEGCGYEYYKWRSTGSSYWRRKFYECRDDED